MTDPNRRVWRAGPATLTIIWLFTALAAVAIPGLAYLIFLREGLVAIPIGLLVLTVLMLLYVWRFGIHPRLQVTDETVEVVNPFRRHTFAWDDITLVAPGENGLLIGTEDAQAEVWCIQKSNAASRRGRFTRADRVAHELLDVLDERDPPLEDEETGLRIRRARPDESRMLTRLERSASEVALAHIFPAEDHPYPVTAVNRRWHDLLRDRHVRTHVLERRKTAVGYVAFDDTTIRHLGVAPNLTRRGLGSALLEFASQEIYDNGVRQASLWVLVGNTGAQAFYRAHGWVETSERRRSEYPPYPDELQLVRPNPAAPRRSR